MFSPICVFKVEKEPGWERIGSSELFSRPLGENGTSFGGKSRFSPKRGAFASRRSPAERMFLFRKDKPQSAKSTPLSLPSFPGKELVAHSVLRHLFFFFFFILFRPQTIDGTRRVARHTLSDSGLWPRDPRATEEPYASNSATRTPPLLPFSAIIILPPLRPTKREGDYFCKTTMHEGR